MKMFLKNWLIYFLYMLLLSVTGIGICFLFLLIGFYFGPTIALVSFFTILMVVLSYICAIPHKEIKDENVS